MDNETLVHCPIYLLTSSERCWKCGSPQSVVAIGTHGITDESEDVGDTANQNDLILLSNISSMPAEVLDYIQHRNPRFAKRYSHTAELSYYANTCDCGANFGDFYLFSEPGGAFFPETGDDAAQIKYHRMPFSGQLRFACSYSQGIGGFILANAEIDGA